MNYEKYNRAKLSFDTGELESQLADLRDTVERLESEKAGVDQSLASSCEERDELQKMVDDLQADLDKTQEALQHVRFLDIGTIELKPFGLR